MKPSQENLPPPNCGSNLNDTEDQARLAFTELTYSKSLADEVRHWQQEPRS